jgi:hypothetical protein
MSVSLLRALLSPSDLMSAWPNILACHAKKPNGCASGSARRVTRPASAPALGFTQHP